MELKIKIDVNPQFTEAICFLAAALGYPAQTMAQSLKETAQEVKAKREAKTSVKVWGGDELQKYCLSFVNDKKLTIEDITSTLKKFKDKNGNSFQTVKELVEQSPLEVVNGFVELINGKANIKTTTERSNSL